MNRMDRDDGFDPGVAYMPVDTGLRAVPSESPRLNDNEPKDVAGKGPPRRGSKILGFLLLAVTLVLATSIASFGVRLGWLLAEGLVR